MRKLFIFTFVVSLLYAQQTYTLEQLILKALKNSPDIALAKLDLNISKKQSNQAFSNYLPKIDLYASYGYLQTDAIALTTKTIHDTLYSGNLTLKQLLYDFGKTSGNYESSLQKINAFDATLAESILQKQKEVKIAYYNLLKQEALIEVAQENLKLNQAQLYRAKQYFKAGIRTKVDISDAKVQLLQAQIALENAKFDRQNKEATLQRVIGISNNTNYTVATVTLKTLFQTPLPTLQKDLYECIEFAYQNRPKLQAYFYNYQAQKELIKTSKSSFYPQLYFQGGFNKVGAKKYTLFLDKEEYNANIQLNWNLYSGGNDSAKKEQQIIQTQKALQEENKMKLAIKEEVTKAFIALEKSKKQITLAQNLLELSNEKFMQVSKQYKHGLSDYIELQVARQGYIDAKNNLVINIYDYYINLAILEATIGK